MLIEKMKRHGQTTCNREANVSVALTDLAQGDHVYAHNQVMGGFFRDHAIQTDVR